MCVVRAVTVLQLGKSDPVTHIARASLVKSHLSKFSSFARDGEWRRGVLSLVFTD